MRQITIEFWQVVIKDNDYLCNTGQDEIDKLITAYNDEDDFLADQHDNGLFLFQIVGSIPSILLSELGPNYDAKLIDREKVRIVFEVDILSSTLYSGLKNCKIERVENL